MESICGLRDGSCVDLKVARQRSVSHPLNGYHWSRSIHFDFIVEMARQPTFQSTISRIVPPLCRFVIAQAKMVLLLVHFSCIQVVFMHPIVTKQLIAPTVAAEGGKKAPYLGLNEARCSFSCAYTGICIFLCLSLGWSRTAACSPESKIKSRNSRRACECGRTCPRKQIQEEERRKVLSAQQLVTRKVLRVGQSSFPV